MKNLFCLFLFSVFTLSLSLQAQIECEWEDYGLAFVLPDDFEVTQNDGESFYAKGDAMEFGLFPFADEEFDSTDIALYTLAIAAQWELEELDEVEMVDLNGMEGAYVEGYRDGARFIVVGIIDPESDTNFFATVLFYDDDEVAEEVALEIIDSIEAY